MVTRTLLRYVKHSLPFLILLSVPSVAAEFVPAVRIDAYGGRYYLEDRSPSFDANVFWAVSPAVEFSHKNALIPTAFGQYRRTYEARELIGGSFITHETLDFGGNAKWVHAATDNFLVKPYISYKQEMLVEADGETLGDGLFDYFKFGGGIEFERTGERLRSFRHLLSFYAVRFPHFRSLAAERFGEEIRAGKDVLNFNTYEYTLSLEWLPWERGLLTASVNGAYRDYSDQTVISRLGTYTDAERVDFPWGGDLGIQQAWRGWRLGRLKFEPVTGVHAGFSGLSSNQDHYDVSRLRFIPDYYNYYGFEAGPFARLRVARLEGNLSYDFARREYNQRLVQYEDGAYKTDETIYQNTHSWTYGLSFVLTSFLSAKAQGSYVMGSSNNRFERTYRYNYHAKHWFAGLSYKY